MPKYSPAEPEFYMSPEAVAGMEAFEEARADEQFEEMLAEWCEDREMDPSLESSREAYTDYLVSLAEAD